MMLEKSILVSAALLFVTISGCGQPSATASGETGHDHGVPHHMPRSLVDLCRQVRVRLEMFDSNRADDTTKSELTDLVSWTPEFAADTDIGEGRWLPIYELSEQIRLSIESDPQDWDVRRRDQIIRLCQISEDAWRSLQSHQRVERYQGHSHGDHGHDHGHGHGHDHDHDHDHDHGHDHDDEHDHDHGHDHGEAQHADTDSEVP